MDLDRFKEVNDDFGHEVGDQLLIAVADRLRHAIRASDTVARFGGDEFVTLCEEVRSPDEVISLAHRLCDLFLRPFVVEEHEVFVSASVGVSVVDGPDATSRQLLSDADAAMYKAKSRGRARVELFDDSMREETRSRFETANQLHHALVRDELRVEYQPLVDLRTDRVIGMESLVRWEHPERGLWARTPSSRSRNRPDSSSPSARGSWNERSRKRRP